MTVTIEGILSSKASSFWLLDALMSGLRRDPVDFLRDAEALLEVARQRCQAITESE